MGHFVFVSSRRRWKERLAIGYLSLGWKWTFVSSRTHDEPSNSYGTRNMSAPYSGNFAEKCIYHSCRLKSIVWVQLNHDMRFKVIVPLTVATSLI